MDIQGSSHMVYSCFFPSLLGQVAYVIVLTLLLVAPIHSLQQLVYVWFALASMPHLLEVLISYHILSHKEISWYITKVLY